MVMWDGSHAIDRRRRAGHSRLCRNRPRGCAICFVTSIAGRTGLVGEAVYSATKACLDAFVESLLGETARSGVTISVVVPGVVDTGSSRLAAVPMRARGHDRYPPTPSSEPWSAAPPKSGGRGGCGARRPCARWLPALFDGSRSASAEVMGSDPKLASILHPRLWFLRRHNPVCNLAHSSACRLQNVCHATEPDVRRRTVLRLR